MGNEYIDLNQKQYCIEFHPEAHPHQSCTHLFISHGHLPFATDLRPV